MISLKDAISWLTEHWDELSENQKKYICKMITEQQDKNTKILDGQVSFYEAHGNEIERELEKSCLDSNYVKETLEKYFADKSVDAKSGGIQ